jgi:exportin-2 (importin alpha re-exporter)
MRVIITVRQTLTPEYELVLHRLINILGIIPKNSTIPTPACPKMLCDRFIVGASPSALPTFEPELFGPFTVILQQDIDRESFLAE